MTETRETLASRSVRANELDHHVLEWGPRAGVEPPGDARTAFLVHGFQDAAGSWEQVAPALAAAGLRVFAPDMRGFGRAPRVAPGGYYHFTDYVLDFADVIDALAPGEPVSLVGHSMGGMIVTLYAGAYPERVARLATLEGLGPPDTPWELGPTRMRSWIDGVRDVRAKAGRVPVMTRASALEKLAANHPQVPREVLAARLEHLVREVPGGVTWSFDPLHRTTAPVPFFTNLFSAYAKKVTCPVLFVDGGPTGFHPPDEEVRLAAFADLRRRVLPGAGHMMHWTAPDALASELVPFLTGQGPV